MSKHISDKEYLKIAIEESKKAQTPHQYGAVEVIDNEIIAIDHNHVWERKDPSAHAEVSAIVSACKKIGSHNLKMQHCTQAMNHV